MSWCLRAPAGPTLAQISPCCTRFADVETFRTAYERHGGKLDPDPAAAAYWVIGDILGILPIQLIFSPDLRPAAPT